MQYEVYTGLISVIYFEDVSGNIGPAQLKHEIELIAKKFNLYPPTTGVLHYRIASTPIPPQTVSHGGYAWSDIEHVLEPQLIPMSLGTTLIDRCSRLAGLDERHKKYVVIDPDD